MTSVETPTPSQPKSVASSIVRFLPGIVFLVALAIRLIGINWGLKNELHNVSLHPDEPIVQGYSQQLEPARGKLTPGFYNYGTLYLTVEKVASDMVSAYTGAPDAKDEISVWSWVSRCHLAGRFLSAIAGAGMVAILYLIAFRFIGMLGAAVSSSILAIAPAHVVHSRFQTVDIFAAFLLLVSLYFALQLLPREGNAPTQNLLKLVALSGLFAGLSGGTKYTGVLGLLSLMTALAMMKTRPDLKPFLVALGATVLGFVVATPGVLLETEVFLKDFKYETLHIATGHGLVFAATPPGFIYHGFNLAVGLGGLITILGAVGLALALKRKENWIWVLLAFAIPYYLLIGRGEVKFLRYTFPLYAPLILGFAWLMVEAHKRSGPWRIVVAAGIFAASGLTLGGLKGLTTTSIAMTNQDPRDAAAVYLRTKGDVTVGLPRDPWFWSPSLYPNVGVPRSIRWPKRQAEMLEKSQPKSVHITDDKGNPTVFDLRLIQEAKPEYICFSSLEWGPGMRAHGASGLTKDQQAESDSVFNFTEALKKDYELERQFGNIGMDAVFLVEDMQYVQPEVYVWKRKQAL